MKLVQNAFFLLLGLGLVFWSFFHVLKQPAPASYQSDLSQPSPSPRRGQTQSAGEVVVEGKIISIEVADTPEARERGPSGRESLPQGSGVLFVFDAPATYGFWMKDMRFPIDIVWLDEEK